MKIYNTLTKTKEEFIPITKNEVRIYVCGQTVYDYCHLGHARKALVFDMIRRWFIACNYNVLFVENITDIDDKIIKRAIENNESINDLTTRFITYMHEDFDKLGILRPDAEPRATEYISQMLTIIDDLVKKGYAYQADNKDIYFAVRKFNNYGKLSGKTIDELISGERVEVDLHKKDPLDFVLWKASKVGETYWDSKYGNGRPGWHIECSAMAEELLGKNFDIHGGGEDLQFPHHENEIAQSEAHNGCTFANYWLHNGFLRMDNEKMSKSLGNFVTLRDVLNQYDPEVIRLLMLKTHYRSPLNFTQMTIEDAKSNLTKLYTAIKPYETIELKEIDWENVFAKKFKAALNDDFNTPLALSVLHEIAHEINKEHNQALANVLVNLANILGLLTRNAAKLFNDVSVEFVIKIENLIKERSQAKLNKDFQLADNIRKDLLQQGIVLEDTANGTIWRKEIN